MVVAPAGVVDAGRRHRCRAGSAARPCVPAGPGVGAGSADFRTDITAGLPRRAPGTRGTSVVRQLAVTICGLIALISLPLLWTAWSRPMFWLIVALACGAILALFLLIRTWPHERF